MANRRIVVEFLGKDTSLGKTAGQLDGKGKRLGLTLGKLGAAFGGLVVARKAADFLRDATAEARESQKVNALTAQVIKTTGGAAKVTAGQVGDLATAISNKTGIDDEAVQSGSNLLLTFKNIRNEAGKGSKIFDRATQAAVDLSKAGFGSIESTSKQLGKALNDPIKGMSALGRAGVTFTASQQKQIKAMVKQGDLLGAQKIMLKEVESQVGGAAQAQVTAGERASVAWNNLKEKIGTALLPVLDRLEATVADKIIPAISGFVTQMQDGTGAGGKVADALQRVGDVLSTVFTFISNNKAVVATFVGSIIAITAAFAAWNAVMAINPLTLIVVGIAAVAAGLVYAYKHSETFRTVVDGLWNKVLKPFGKWLGSVLPGVIRTVGTVFLTMAEISVKAFHFLLNAVMTVFGGILKGAAKAFGWVPGLGGKIKAASKGFDAMKDTANAALTKVEHKIGDAKGELRDLGKQNPKPRVGLDTSSFRASLKYVIASMNRIGRLSASAKANLHASNVGKNASGTDNWRGGLTWVGERGPELLNLPSGSQIFPHRESVAMASSAGRGQMQRPLIVQLVVDGKVLHQSLLKEKRLTGTPLGLA